ncbi:MAG TPA: DEAD/DEAH box helicase family protein [Microthrixaceae bacterium]|nr:DEAD/DEAH box helicase family protein [Microthrixaceae bacterium]
MTRDLRVLDACKLKWRLPEDEIAGEVLIPALKVAEAFDCMVGYFGGQALRHLAPGLAAFVANGDQAMRLLVSPLLSDDDLAGIKMGLTTPEEVLADAVGASLTDAVALEDALAQHTLHCFAYLLAAKRLEMKVVLIDDGIFHVKEWIFRSGGDLAVLSGSANFTGRAISRNVESLHLHRSWRDADNLDSCTESAAEFDLLWSGRKHRARTVDLPDAVAEDLIRTYGSDRPTEADFEDALARATLVPDEESSATRFTIPSYLEIDEGPYSHQGRAVAAWEAAGRKGILAMATGAGKTISALVATRRLLEERQPLAIVIAVPTRPLVTQWAAECAEFGLRPLVAPVMAKQKRLRAIQHALDNLTFEVSDVEAIIVTNEGLVDPDFRLLLDSYDGASILIADEVHNLGGIRDFITDPPSWPTAKLGLSATPIRQYDDEGTEALLRYFGEVVFEFTLDDAIGVCLVPYDYFVHRVDLTEPEREKYAELTERIRRRVAAAGGEFSSDDLQLTILLNQRRLILETADGKLAALEALLDRQSGRSITRTLFYATDKDPRQLDEVNEILRSRHIRAHQVTESETSRGRLLAATMDAFASGVLHALTAKRVLALILHGVEMGRSL